MINTVPFIITVSSWHKLSVLVAKINQSEDILTQDFPYSSLENPNTNQPLSQPDTSP